MYLYEAETFLVSPNNPHGTIGLHTTIEAESRREAIELLVSHHAIPPGGAVRLKIGGRTYLHEIDEDRRPKAKKANADNRKDDWR